MAEAAKRERDWLVHGCLFLAVILLAYVVSTPGTSRLQALSRMSGLLQLAGISTAFLSLRGIRKQLKLPDMLDEIRSDFNAVIDAVRKTPKTRTLATEVGAYLILETRGYGTVSLPPDATVEQRLAHLQSQVDGLITATREQERQSVDDRTKWDAAITELKATTADGFKKLNDKLRGVTSAGMRLEVIGLLWLAVGVLLPSFSSVAWILWPSQ